MKENGNHFFKLKYFSSYYGLKYYIKEENPKFTTSGREKWNVGLLLTPTNP